MDTKEQKESSIPAAGQPSVEQIALAAKEWDWMQTVLHQGEPCFYVQDDGHFCGRAKQWDGHDEIHAFVSLEQCFLRAIADATAATEQRLKNYIEESERQFLQIEGEKTALTEQVAVMRKDKERLDWICDRCYLPNDHPNGKICLLIPESVIPLGKITLNSENDRKIIREAIDRAALSTPQLKAEA